MTHTSVRLPEDLESQARRYCAERGISFASFIQLALRNQLQNNAWAEAEKRQAATIGTIGKKIDKSVEANRAGFALFLALTEELLSHIYPDGATVRARMKQIFRDAQAHHGATVKDFIGDADGK